jgi:hypothetical protein
MNCPNEQAVTECNEELVSVLFAISVIAKRLARSLQYLDINEEGGGDTNG